MIRVSLEHRFKHVFYKGMTGAGKTTNMLSLALQDIRAGHGVAMIDPHGELADDLLARFPENRADDLIYIDIADPSWRVPLNPLLWKTKSERDVIVDGFLSAFLRIYRDPQMMGPVFESHFRPMFKLLMGSEPNSNHFTLLEFVLLYQNRQFRRYLLEQTDDDQVRDFVAEMEAVSHGDYRPENIATYICGKLARFTQDGLLQHIFGHGDMAVDFDSVINEGKVLVLKLARGRFGASVTDLITSLIISGFRIAIMNRVGISKDQRKPFFLFVDELGSLSRDETLSQLLSEARKYSCGLVLATQYASQLRDVDYSRNTLSAILGNVGTIVSYRVGVEDAPLLAPLFAPALAAQDLLECPNFQGYIRLHLNQVATRPFSFHNLPDLTPPDRARAQRLIERSRKRWSVPAEECAERLAERRKFIQSLT